MTGAHLRRARTLMRCLLWLILWLVLMAAMIATLQFGGI